MDKQSQAVEVQSKEIPEPSKFETKDLQKLLQKGHSAYWRVGVLTIIGLLLLIAGLLYYDKFDYYPVVDHKVSLQKFSGQYFASLIEGENNRQAESYVLRPGIAKPPKPPKWPEVLYNKLRFDIYFIGVLVFLFCFIIIRISIAKSQKNDLLVFRSMAREIERLRLQVSQLEADNANKNSENK